MDLYRPPGDREPDAGLAMDAHLACLWEATARKPGNVHPYRAFADTTYLDFVVSAALTAQVMAFAPHHLVGATVSEAVRLTRRRVKRNTNLGIALLLAPLAKAAPGRDHRAEVRRVLDSMDPAEGGAEGEGRFPDASQVYHAIATAAPGGLGEAGEQDVRGGPTAKLLDCMALAQGRDLIARQYADGFAEVFDDVAPAILAGVGRTGCLEDGIVEAHLVTMAKHPDSLIARKLGVEAAREASARAADVLAAGWPQSEAGRRAIAAFDDWLRADGNRRNPGTTADLIAAGLFVLLRARRLGPGEALWSRPSRAAAE